MKTFGCIGNTIKVSTGNYVDLANPDPASIDIRDIAAALSKICRYGGHCPNFYSVAEHSFWAYQIARQMNTLSRDCLKAILLHDATEAYVGDMVKPLKIMLPEYDVIEKRFETAIGKAFGIRFEDWKPQIKHIDMIMLKSEKLTLWPEDDGHHWTGFETVEAKQIPFAFLRPTEAEDMFLTEAIDLGFAQPPEGL